MRTETYGGVLSTGLGNDLGSWWRSGAGCCVDAEGDHEQSENETEHGCNKISLTSPI